MSPPTLLQGNERTTDLSTEGKTRKRMGITAIISSIFIVATLVWGIYGFILVQSGNVRIYDPHYEYDTIEYWPYTHEFAGRYGSWFDNLNYTNFNLDIPLPDDLLDRMNEPVFYVAPADPGQLWRMDSFDVYDGSSWSKSLTGRRNLIQGEELIPIAAATNPIYAILFNATAGAEVGSISLPSLFPYIRVIEDSFETYTLVDDMYVLDDPTRLLHYDLETDDYGTLLFSPLIEGTTGENVAVSFLVTFVNQDIDLVQSTALEGALAPANIRALYNDLSLVQPLSQRVLDNVSQFSSVGTNAYQKALAVQIYFQSTFELTLTQEALFNRPDGQEVTDWFLENGGGLPMDFATAYCVFMRQLGIPARMVSGYALGEPHPTEDLRVVMIRHMTFWAEVFIPMSGHPDGGEWIQVIPTPLPDDMGGDEIPDNVPIPDIELIIWPTDGQYWALTGTPFGLSAAVTIDGVLVTTPDLLYFYDETDAEVVGQANIGTYLPGIANLTYTFPGDAIIDYHTITATWMNQYFMVTNATYIYAVGTPVPMSKETSISETPAAIIAETHDLDINQGLDTHVALWEDTVHVYGVMTVGGVPVNSSNYGNQYIQIIWDETVIGDAFINEYGYYDLNVYVDPLDLALMKVGQHNVYSSYAGDWDPIGGFYRLLPANSTYTSVVTVWGRVGFDLTVTPSPISPGSTLTYDGRVYFLNGTSLSSGQTVGTFFGSQANTTIPLNGTGGFQWSYMIPAAQSEGTYFARANWTSAFPYIAGNWSISIPIDVGAGGTQIILNPLPDPVFIGETYTIWGYLQHVSNSSGIGSQWVDVYWSAGSTILIGSSLTAPDGYFEVTYLIPAGYEGSVSYWANFTSPTPSLTDSESFHFGTLVKRYDVEITIFDNPDPIKLLQTVTIQGIVSLPENASSPLIGELVEIYWANTTYPLGILIGTTTTNSTGGYAFYYQIPISHTTELVTFWVHFTSPYTNIADGDSIPETLLIEATDTLITVYSDATSYYLNDTVLITGNLQFANGTPITNQRVYISWINGSGTWIFEKWTDLSGNYQFLYNLSAKMDTGVVNVFVEWTSFSPLYNDANDTLAPPIQLYRYDYVLTLTVPTEIYVDENLVIQGTLESSIGTPIVGASIITAYWNGSNWLGGIPITNSSGGFTSGPLPFANYNEENLLCVVYYESPDPMVNNITQYFYVNRIRYAVNLEITVLPNPVMQNGTVTIHAYLYFAHNGTPISGVDVSIYWYNGTMRFVSNITTDGTGQGDLFYSGMAYDTARTNILVYGNYAGSALLAGNVSTSLPLTLEQWQSTLVGLFTPVTVYGLQDTITVTGELWYVSPFVPYGYATVELLLDGIPIDNTVTASDGSFLLTWGIPTNTTIGFYDLEVRYLAPPPPWILGTLGFVENIEISAPGYLFPSFIVSPESPTPVIILDYLTISGLVTWTNGSPYAFSWVELHWSDPLGTHMVDVLTNSTGGFTTTYQVPEGTQLGTRQVWAYIPPAGIVTSGTSSSRTIDIQTHALIITASVDVVLAHLGDTITISGTAHFANGTSLWGYSIEIWWHSTLWSTEIVDVSGNFSYGITIPYDEAVGVHSGYVYFTAPTAAFSDEQIYVQDVETREYIYLYLDAVPGDNSYSRGDTVLVTGYVTNDDGVPLPVEIRVQIDGNPTSSTGFTSAISGTFSIPWIVSTGTSAGLAIITIQSISSYRDVLLNSDSWSIYIVIDSTLSVSVATASYMPGETFTIQISLYDGDGTPVNSVPINIRLGSILIDTVFLTDGSGTPFSIVIPTSWSSDGYFTITAEFEGLDMLYGDTDVSTNSIQVFTEVVFNNRSQLTIPPGNAFSIEVRLTDPDQNPIPNRDVLLNLNGTRIIPLTTDADGIISYNLPGYDEEGILQFSITLTSGDVPSVVSGAFGIRIQTQGGITLQGTDLIIAGVLLVGAIIAVLAYLYIVKGMFRSVVISRGIDIPTKLRNIKKLADAGKYGASITLAYRTFEQMCGAKIGSERAHSETAREYLDRVLQSIPLDGSTAEQFVQTYEEARFSHHEMTRERYEAALRIFTDLYPRIDTGALME